MKTINYKRIGINVLTSAIETLILILINKLLKLEIKMENLAIIIVVLLGITSVIFWSIWLTKDHRLKVKEKDNSITEKFQDLDKKLSDLIQDLDKKFSDLIQNLDKKFSDLIQLQAEINREIMKYKPIHELIGNEDITKYENAGIIDKSVT